MPLLPRTRRRLLLFVALVGVAVIVAGRLHLWPFGGIFVIVKNIGPQPLHDVIVHVTGQSYRIGDVGVGEAPSLRVEPHGQSHVEIEFTDDAKRRFKHVIGGKFESGESHGTLVVEFENGGIKRVDNQIRSGMW